MEKNDILRAILAIVLPFFLVMNGFAQNDTYILRIHIENAETNVAVKESEVYIDILHKTFNPDMNGFLMIALPRSYYNLDITSPGYIEQQVQLVLTSDTTLTVLLESDFKILEEVTISAHAIDERIAMNQTGLETFDQRQLMQLPSIGGEKDPIKAATLLPGIQSGSEGSSDIVVRGGGTDQNLFLLDNSTLYHTNHLYGFLSTYNPLIIENFDLYKGGFPLQYGGRLSSVIDVKTIRPSLQNFRGEISMGTVSTGATFEIPVVRDKLSVLISGRRTYYDAVQYVFANKNDRESFNFHDFFGKMYFQPNAKHTFSLNTYGDRDIYFDLYKHREADENNRVEQIWKNKQLNFQWEWNPNPSLSNYLNIYNSKYQMNLSDTKKKGVDYYSQGFESYINDITLKDHLKYSLNATTNLNMGVELGWIETQPGHKYFSDNDTSLFSISIPSSSFFNSALYFGIEKKLKNMDFDIGLRSNFFIQQHSFLYSFEPRISGLYKFDPKTSFKISYARMSQPLHLLTNPGLGMPINLWLGYNDNMKPQLSDQFSVGFIKNKQIGSHAFNLNMEGYYKKLYNVTAYRDGFSSSSFTSFYNIRTPTVEESIATGSGSTYGLETFINKTTGDFTGWISYTLSWSKYQFDDINEGRAFWSPFDKRHDFSIVASYKLTPKWRLTGSWAYSTGRPVTIPEYYYPIVDIDYLTGRSETSPSQGSLGVITVNSDRNAHRMKAFHKLELAIQKTFNTKKFNGYFEFGLYNVYNRKNPFYYYLTSNSTFSTDGGLIDKSVTTIKSVSLFPIIPSFRLVIKF